MKGGKKWSEGTSMDTTHPWLLSDVVGNSDTPLHTGGDASPVMDQVGIHREDEVGIGSDALEEEELEGSFEHDDDAQRHNLADGFYEIEAVRRKRIRKGVAQYLIKWRGWPETANTWEPYVNLSSCSDVVDAFEARLSSGKNKSRRRKRKQAGPQLQVKKKQHRSSDLSNIRIVTSPRSRTVKEPLPLICFNSTNHNSGNETINEPFNQENENRTDMGSQPIGERAEPDELVVKLCELKETNITYDDNAAKLLLQETGHGSGSSSQVGPGNGFSKVDENKQVQAGRCTGARRRKSGTVKRFSQDLSLNSDSQVGTRTCGINELQGFEIQNLNFSGSDSVCRKENMYEITEIIKPISCAACERHNVQDVLVTFMAMRSDGKEVVVDNKYLKAHHPLLLINYYEKNIRYTVA